jgi:CheY-like chemotaxis protein
MAGAIAHHFNNKLFVVMGYLDLAIDGLASGDTSKANLTIARQEADKAAEVSKLMLTYLGQVTGKLELLELTKVCQKILPLIEVTLPKNVVMKTNLQFPGPVIKANADQIRQVLTNLIINAWEAAGDEPGSIYLVVKTVSPADISTSYRFPIDWQPDNTLYACLEIRDKGCGIVDKDIEEVFSPFFTTKFIGRGLGLSVILGLVKAHGGAVTVESVPSQGSVFRVFFPISSEGIVQQPHKEAKARKIQEAGKVLLVDDDETVLEITNVMLSALGFTVLRAMDGIEAVEVFRQNKHEIRFVITDVAMPRMNGWETLHALRQIMPGIPVILASGYSEALVMEGLHSERPQAFLGKPYGFQALSDTIRRILLETKD